MAESKVRDDNFFLVSGWMLNRLNLKGVALQVFSIIYGFSQDGESFFTGSLQYLSDFTNASKPTIIKALKELVDKDYLIKIENEMNGVKFNKYKANLLVVKNFNGGSQDSLPGGSKETLLGGSKETLPNKEIIDNKSLISKEIVNEVIDLYHSICVSFPKVKVVTDSRKKAIKERLDTYSIDDMRTVFENAEQSSFLKGKNDRNWSANFDWLIGKDNIVKVLEGNYRDKGRKEVTPYWMNGGKRELDDDEKEAIQRMLAMPKEPGIAELNAIQRILAEPDDEPNTIGNDPELAERAARLREELQGV